MPYKQTKLYAFCKFIEKMCKEIIRMIEDGEYRNAITYLESLSNHATNIQIEESCEDPHVSFIDLKKND